jgi:hypothetical protein
MFDHGAEAYSTDEEVALDGLFGKEVKVPVKA